MKRILVAVDFSECSRRAFQTAVSLSRAFDTGLHVVYVAPEMYGSLNASEAILPVGEKASLIERRLTDFILEQFHGSAEEFARIDKKILEGIDWIEIVKEAEHSEPALIVAGTHGRSLVERAFLGSVSDKILRKAPVSVLLVPETGNPRPEKLLVAINDDAEAAESLLRLAETWREALKGSLTALHVIENAPEPELLAFPDDLKQEPVSSGWEDQLRQALQWTAKQICAEPTPKVEIRAGRPYREICRHVEAGGYQLVLLGADPKISPALGGTVLRVAHRAPCSVLLLR